MKLSVGLFLTLLEATQSFHSPAPMFGVRTASRLFSTAEAVAPSEATAIEPTEEQESSVVRAPLRYLGSYPALSLRFPDLSTSSQRERGNATGVSLDFILDTAANTNTINAQVAQELDLEVAGQAPPGLGAGGAMAGGDTFMLGDCELEGIEDPFTFMQGLTASALPVASPASAGLLSLAFLQCFEGGVEFAWGKVEVDDDDDDKKKTKIVEYPAVTFHGDDQHLPAEVLKNKATITPLDVTLLPTVMVKVNGVEMPALLDTGSPITVLNSQAAMAAGVDLMMEVEDEASLNPFQKVANNFKLAQAASRGEVLTLASAATGQPVYLVRSSETASMSVGEDNIDFGSSNLYVGDLPGLAAMNGLGVDAPPAVVLGMDVLQRRSKMLLRGQQNEVYFN